MIYGIAIINDEYKDEYYFYHDSRWYDNHNNKNNNKNNTSINLQMRN